MADETRVVVLTEAAAFDEARQLIDRAKKEVWERFTRTWDTQAAYSLGKLEEALDAAGAAVFNALNVASSHCHCDASQQAIRAWHLRLNEEPS